VICGSAIFSATTYTVTASAGVLPLWMDFRDIKCLARFMFLKVAVPPGRAGRPTKRERRQIERWGDLG